MLNGRVVVEASVLDRLVAALDGDGFDVWMPSARDGIVTSRRFRPGDEFPIGYVGDQSPGSYTLTQGGGRSRFAWAAGPQPWKPLLHPADVVTMTMRQDAADAPVAVTVSPTPPRPVALFGLRPCDLAAVDKLDRVLLETPPTAEPTYERRRDEAFIVVVNCGVPAATCFCASVDTGPHVDGRSTSHDLEITELPDDDPEAEPHYVVESFSERGTDLVASAIEGLETEAVDRLIDQRVADQRRRAEAAMGRRLPAHEIASALSTSHGSTRWADVAEECLACGNCTAVCPTCFCTTIDDIGDLTGTEVERHRRWESCFSLEFSRLGRSSVRASLASRYRQWMTHKLSTWHDQFGESGCVGCGRCTTWCPAGIDFVSVAQGFVDETAGVGS